MSLLSDGCPWWSEWHEGVLDLFVHYSDTLDKSFAGLIVDSSNQPLLCNVVRIVVESVVLAFFDSLQGVNVNQLAFKVRQQVDGLGILTKCKDQVQSLPSKASHDADVFPFALNVRHRRYLLFQSTLARVADAGWPR